MISKGIPCYSCRHASVILHDDKEATFGCDLYQKEVDDIEVLWDNPNGLNVCDGYISDSKLFEDD